MSIMDRNKANYARNTDLRLNIYPVELGHPQAIGQHAAGIRRWCTQATQDSLLSQLNFEDSFPEDLNLGWNMLDCVERVTQGNTVIGVDRL